MNFDFRDLGKPFIGWSGTLRYVKYFQPEEIVDYIPYKLYEKAKHKQHNFAEAILIL